MIIHPGNSNFAHPNFLIRHALNIAYYNGCFFTLIIPILSDYGIIGADYQKEDNRGRAKTNLILLSILLPGTILFSAAVILTGEIGQGILIFIIPYIYFFVKSVYQIYKE